MASSNIQLYVKVVYPECVSLQMFFGCFCAMVFKNSRYLLKYGWNIYILDGEIESLTQNTKPDV